ncbi:hypothetical protein VKT23_013031 [Stygiomarasmius scandens]|uniref:Uncharacterized protein n=1 Tax=Marasmiellus scandens TaxID=2682957 RepID=A0ABR1J900_9AGAR
MPNSRPPTFLNERLDNNPLQTTEQIDDYFDDSELWEMENARSNQETAERLARVLGRPPPPPPPPLPQPLAFPVFTATSLDRRLASNPVETPGASPPLHRGHFLVHGPGAAAS